MVFDSKLQSQVLNYRTCSSTFQSSQKNHQEDISQNIHRTRSFHVYIKSLPNTLFTQYFFFAVSLLETQARYTILTKSTLKQTTRGGRIRLGISHLSNLRISEVFLAWFLPLKRTFISSQESYVESSSGRLRPSLPTFLLSYSLLHFSGSI